MKYFVLIILNLIPKVTNHFYFKNMKNALFVLSIVLAIFSCNPTKDNLQISSPDRDIKLTFLVNEKGQAGYIIDFQNKRVIDTSYFSFDFKDQKSFGLFYLL